VKPITEEELLDMFDPEVRDRLLALAYKPGIKGLIVFENLMMDSSAFGSRTAVAFGPSCTYQKPDDVVGKWLNDLPSQRQHPQHVFYRPKGKQLTLWRLN
jgi:hypothetical protein